MMSTYVNTIYYNSYNVAIKMANELGVTIDANWFEKAEKLKVAINNYLWNEKTGQYNLYIDDEGICEIQEALGDTYAIMFGVADEKQTELILKILSLRYK